MSELNHWLVLAAHSASLRHTAPYSYGAPGWCGRGDGGGGESARTFPRGTVGMRKL